ncbi:MAG TPA: hypothetical protein VHZ54_02150 [Solirubrobacterales bacterium]|nr:hypothetical protein [Solirubrobacterales bacterium]
MTEPAQTDLTAGERIEKAVLLFALDVHPVSLTAAELIRGLDARDESTSHEAAEIEDAVARLIEFGLLHRNGKLIFVTLAAARFNELSS